MGQPASPTHCSNGSAEPQIAAAPNALGQCPKLIGATDRPDLNSAQTQPLSFTGNELPA